MTATVDVKVVEVVVVATNVDVVVIKVVVDDVGGKVGQGGLKVCVPRLISQDRFGSAQRLAQLPPENPR